MIERVRWALFKRYNDRTPYITRFESRDGDVGEQFFGEWARETGATLTQGTPGIGILDSLRDLASDDFDPSKVNSMVRAVYENTSVMDFRAGSVEWGGRFARAFHWSYQRLIARRMLQLCAPVDYRFLPTLISSHIDRVESSDSDLPNFRAWTRRYARSNTIFYTAAAFVFGADGDQGTQRYLCCVLPMVHLNLAVVFHPENLAEGGFKISTYKEGSYCAGVYTVFPGKDRFCVMPAPMKEHIELRCRDGHSGAYIEGRHETWAFGRRSYRLHYQVRGPFA